MNTKSNNSERRQKFNVALVGNPNSGKTTIFNALTGLRYKVANYPGVTVERKEGSIKLDEDIEISIIDLPGIYSLTGKSIDEQIAAQDLLGLTPGNSKPDLILSIVDANNLERNLYLTTQLLDLEIPIVLVLTMVDLADRRGISIKKEILSSQLDIPVIATSAYKDPFDSRLREAIREGLQKMQISKKSFAWLQICSPFRESAIKLATQTAIKKGELPPILVGAQLLSGDLELPVKSESIQLVHAEQKELESKGVDPTSFEATNRYQFVNWLIKRSVSISDQTQRRFSDRVDEIITHRIWGVVFFLLMMAAMFQAIFIGASVPMELIDNGISAVGSLITQHMSEGPLRSLLVDGVIAGVGSVVIFIPQIAILFLFLGVLEDSGYLARAAFIMDRLMRHIGLQGRSFIPLLSSFACAIPGIMSTRTIPSITDRLITILVAPLMSCSARLPVYTLLISAFIPNKLILGFISLQGLVLLSMYLLGVLGAAFVAWLLKLSLLRGKPALFIMEMPPFRRPHWKIVIREVYDRVILFLKGAGTIILACSIILWFLASFPKGEVQDSYAGQIGHVMEPIISPLGFNWEIGVGILASFAAREVFVTTLATVYNLQDTSDTTQSLVSVLQEHYSSGTFSLASALALMVFYVFACQCISTLAICKRETASYRWPIFMFVYMSLLAYIAAFLTYHIALYFT